MFDMEQSKWLVAMASNIFHAAETFGVPMTRGQALDKAIQTYCSIIGNAVKRPDDPIDWTKLVDWTSTVKQP